MSSCKLDHSLSDVKKKLADQRPFLPDSLAKRTYAFLEPEVDQTNLNELFHLLKKYDLASAEEKTIRNHRLEQLLK